MPSEAMMGVQVLDNSLEAHVMRSDNSSLAKDCRKDIKAANARLLKLGRKVCAPPLQHSVTVAGPSTWCCNCCLVMDLVVHLGFIHR